MRMAAPLGSRVGSRPLGHRSAALAPTARNTGVAAHDHPSYLLTGWLTYFLRTCSLTRLHTYLATHTILPLFTGYCINLVSASLHAQREGGTPTTLSSGRAGPVQSLETPGRSG